MTDKILCPYCGAEMERSVVVIDTTKDDCKTCLLCTQCHAQSPLCNTWTEAKEAALRRYTPPQPMTLEELEKRIAVFDIRDGDTYYVEHKDSRSEWRTAMHIWYGLFLHKDVKEQYGKKWRCWERKPTDEERSAAEWET